MRDPLSNKIKDIQPSGIRKFFDIVTEMKDAISLGVGEPDFDTPWRIRREGIRSLETGVNHLYHHKFDDMASEELKAYVAEFRDDNIFAVAELFRRGVSVAEVHEITKITAFFLEAMKNIVEMEKVLELSIPLTVDVSEGKNWLEQE